MVKEAMETFVGGVQMKPTSTQLLLFEDDLMLETEKNKDVESNLIMLMK